MSWHPLPFPDNGRPRGRRFPGPVAVSARQEVDGPRLWVLVDKGWCKEKLGWAQGDRISSLEGTDDHEGDLLLFKGDHFNPRALRGQGNAATRLYLRIVMPGCMDAETKGGMCAEYHVAKHDGQPALRVTIPEEWR